MVPTSITGWKTDMRRVATVRIMTRARLETERTVLVGNVP
jgi:hypothetical protein